MLHCVHVLLGAEQVVLLSTDEIREAGNNCGENVACVTEHTDAFINTVSKYCDASMLELLQLHWGSTSLFLF